MKSAKNLVSKAVMFAVLVAIAIPAYPATQSGDPPTKDEVTSLLKNAKTPLEHHRIAMYYNQEASRLRQEAEGHRAWANIYGKGQGAIHCTNLVKTYEQGARDADALATMHENMAKAVEQKV
jgi:hypothetical protein